MARELPGYWNNLVFPLHESVVYLCNAGTGFLIGSQKGCSLILTCHHVIEDYTDRGLVKVHLLGKGSLTGFIIHEDKGLDIALVMVLPSHAPGPAITGEPLKFSDQPHSETTGRDLVMLGYFSLNCDTIKEPGTSHGYSMGEEVDIPENLLADYTSQCGNSGSPVFLMGAGQSPQVIGMHNSGFPGSIVRRSSSVAAIRESLNKSRPPGTPEMTIPEAIERFFDIYS